MAEVGDPPHPIASKSDKSNYLSSLGYRNFSIEVNDQCNFHCVYCPYDTDETHEFAVMDKEKAKEIISDLAVNNALDDYLLFNALGEPLMYSGLFDLIKFANEVGLKTKLVTNGSLLTKNNIESLLDSNPTLLKISVESLDSEIFSQLRGTTIKFETYVERIANLIASSLEIGTHLRSYIQLDLIYAEPIKYLVNRWFGLESPDPGRTGLYTRKRRLNRDLESFIGKLVNDGYIQSDCLKTIRFDDKAYDSKEKPLVSISRDIGFHIKPYERWKDIFERQYPIADDVRGCQVDNLAVHADGRVVLCCIDYNASTAIGNIFDKSLDEILTEPGNVAIINDLRQGKYHFDCCKSCRGNTTFVSQQLYGTARLQPLRKVIGSFKRRLVH